MAVEQGSDRVIRVQVRVYAGLRRYLPGLPLGQSATIDLPPEATIGDALDQLGIPRSETKSCFVNGLKQDFDHPLKENDELAAFPPVAGGADAVSTVSA